MFVTNNHFYYQMQNNFLQLIRQNWGSAVVNGFIAMYFPVCAYSLKHYWFYFFFVTNLSCSSTRLRMMILFEKRLGDNSLALVSGVKRQIMFSQFRSWACGLYCWRLFTATVLVYQASPSRRQKASACSVVVNWRENCWQK